MRIGIDARTLSYPYSGIPIYVHDVISYWNKYEIEDEFFLYSNRPFSLDFELGSNWHVFVDEHKYGGIWTQTRIPYLLQRDKVDAYWEPMNFLPRRVKGVKYFVTIHDMAVYLYPWLGTVTDAILERLLLKRSCHRADRIIAISKSTKQDIVNYLGSEEDKINVIYNGDSPYTGKEPSYNSQDEKAMLDKWELCSGNFLLFVGTIEPRKNIDSIVSAYELLRNQRKYSGKLVIAGRPGWKSHKVLTHIKKSKYRKDIVVTDYISESEKECLYRNAECLLFISLYEGFGFPIVEAMSVGLPVITSSVSSMPEVGGDAATYIEKEKLRNAEAIASAITDTLSESPVLQEKTREKMLKRAAEFKREDSAMELYTLITAI